MWRPPERIKHDLPAARWPSAEEAAASLLFTPLRVGPIELHERTWVPAMVPWRATDDGHVSQDVLDWYERFAEGQPGALVVEATGVRDIPSGPLLRIGHDRFLPGLEKLATTVKRASGGRTRLFIQILDFLTIRRRPDPATYFGRFLAITDRHRDALRDRATTDEEIRGILAILPNDEIERILDSRELEALRFGLRERVTDTHLPHVRELPRVLPGIFADAASRAEAAGFDGVELHFAHAYTLASFLSARNDRDDGYGRSLAGRVRLPLEVVAAVKARASAGFVVGCRYLADERIDGGSSVDDACFFGVELARAGLDFLSLSRGGKFEDAKQPAVGEAAYPYTGPSGYECMPTTISDSQGPFGRNVEPTGRIRRAVRDAGLATPIVAGGGIASFDQAESILQRGLADLVASARQSLADPDWFHKMRLGHGPDIRRCTFTNYCEALDQRHAQVTCKLWDLEGLDQPGIPLSIDGRRRLIAPR